MKRLVLFLIMLAAISPAMGVGDEFVGIGNTALVDDFQHHPGLDPTDIWYTNNSADVPIVYLIENYPVSYSQSLSIRAPSTGHMKPKTSLSAPSSYWAYTVRSGSNTTDCTNVIKNEEKFLNSAGGVVATIGISGVLHCPPGNYEYIVSGGIVRLYINGVDMYNTTITDIPTNIQIYMQNALYKDDVHTTTGIIGMQSRFTEADSDVQVSYSPYIKYAYPSSTYSVDVVRLSTGVVYNTTTVTNYSGVVVWDRQSTLQYQYGVYRTRLLKDGSQEAFHDFFYVPSAVYGTLVFDKDIVMQSEPANYTYTLNTPDFVSYTYRASLVDQSGNIKDYVFFNDIAGSRAFVTDGLPAGTYYGLLERCVSGCTTVHNLIAYDIIGIQEGFNVQGYTYDAMNGTILGGVNVNISQAGGETWFNTTSNATTGYYNLSALLTVSTTFNASKTNYTHEAFTVSPTFPGNKTVNFYLWPSNLTHSNTTIQGLTVDYPYHQAVPSATVNVYNATNTTTTTSNSWGYYQVETNNSAYSVNGTKSGYRASNVYSVTPALNEWKVQNIVLYPIYNITIRAKDSVTLAFINSFTTEINGVLYQTTNGTVRVQLEYGTYTISTSAQGYSGSTGSINVDSDATETILLAPYTTTTNTNNNVDFISTQVYEKFIVRGLFDNPYPGLTLEVFNGSSDTVSFTGTTDSMGQVVFKLTKDVYYRGELTGSTIDPLIFYFYGKEESYLITIMTGFPSGGDRFHDISANLTTSTFNATYSNLSVIYNDTISSTAALNFYATNLTTGTTCTKTSALSVVRLNCTVLARGTYQFGYNATSSVYGFFREDKIINFGAGNTSAALIPTKPPAATTGADTTIMQWGSIMLIVLTASLFSIKTLKLGAVIVPTEALILWAFGWLSADWKLLAIAIVIGVLIYMRLSESKVAYQ